METPGGAAGEKLDLSKLTDEEVKHVWEVVQRDFSLRRKEEDRLGELKSKIEREDTKTELLGNQTSLTESYCIRCLQPFRFLVNIKRQCLDCQLHVCKSCSRYNQKEQGWVCDPCHLSRVLRIGTLEWYHENVRARFKRFGSAKVMRSLFKRLDDGHSCSQSDLRDGLEDLSLVGSDSPRVKEMKKTKRRLTVDPCDFSNVPGHHEDQASDSRDIIDAGGREAALAEAAVFHHKDLDLKLVPQHDDPVSVENRTTSRSVSQLSFSSGGSGSAGGLRGGSSFLPSLDDSEAEEDLCQQVHHADPEPCSRPPQDRRSSTSTTPQVADLNRRMSAMETLLNRLEQKVTSSNEAGTPRSTSPGSQLEDVDIEEQQLRQKLHELTDNISDQSLNSDEDESSGLDSSEEIPVWGNPQMDPKPSRIPTRPTSRASTMSSRLEEELPEQADSQKLDYSTESLERRERPLQEPSRASFRGSTALLFELEDKVAQAAANVQNAQSQVSYIENRIAALNATGVPSDKRRRSAIPIQTRRLSHNFPTNQVDSFDRNSLYRGSLTQRNPVAKPKTRATCAKPVMMQGS